MTSHYEIKTYLDDSKVAFKIIHIFKVVKMSQCDI
jgi:hypothetical protein